MGFGAGDSNLYRYAANRPLSASDPSGLVLTVEGTGKDDFTIVNGTLITGIQKKLRFIIPKSDEFKTLANRIGMSYSGGEKAAVEYGIQIATEMATSGYKYDFKDWDVLVRNIVYRLAIVEEANLFSQRKFGFPPDSDKIAFSVKGNVKGWKQFKFSPPWEGIQLQNGTTAAEGLDYLLQSKDESIGFNCNSALVLIYLRAELDITRVEKQFNDKYTGPNGMPLILGTGDVHKQYSFFQPVQEEASSTRDDFVTGDWGKFASNSGTVAPIWKSENAIYIKKNNDTLFFAHLPWVGPTLRYPNDIAARLTGIYSERALLGVLHSKELDHMGARGPYTLSETRWIPHLK